MIDGELTETEIGYLRRDGQKAKYYMAFLDTPTVFAAQVNQTFSKRDGIIQITYDGVTFGAYTDIKAGMTCLVGSSAGARDYGQVRIRKAATSTVLYIGATSEINWANNLHLTVIDDYGLWAKSTYTSDKKVLYMDYDVPYTNQHTYMLPFAVVGADRVVRLSGESVTLAWDASGSWCPGDTIDEYLWLAPGSSASSGLDTATPSITYNVIGTYRVSCRVTTTNSKTAWAYRNVFVWDDAHPPLAFDPADQPASDFVFTSPPHGSYDRGGWDFSVRMFGQAAESLVQPRKKVILFSRTFYGDDEISIGPLLGAENIIMIGWIDGETIDPDSRGGSVAFEVHGPAHWLDMITGPSLSLEHVAGTSAAWDQIHTLNVRRALAHYITWCTTLPLCVDIQITDDTRISKNFDATIGTVWRQIGLLAARILAKPGCDCYGRLFVDVETQYVPEADRTAIPEVMQADKVDRANISLKRGTSASVGYMQISGLYFTGSGDPTTLYSQSGHYPGRFGRYEQARDGFMVASQAKINEMCGLMMGRANNPYPDVEIKLASASHFVDVFPRQYLRVPVEAGDTPRELAFSGRVVPKEITFEHHNGYLLPTIHGEAETFKALSVKGAGLNWEKPPSPPTPPPPPPPPPTPPPTPPPPSPPPSLTASVYVLMAQPGAGYGIYYTENFDDAEPEWTNKAIGGPGAATLLMYLEIDRNAGILYTGAPSGLWYGNLGDPYLTQFVDQAWLDAEFPLGGVSPSSDNNRIGSFGINQLVPNSLIISAGSGYLGTRSAFLYTGSYAGLTKKVEIPWPWNDGGIGNFTIGNANVWAGTLTAFLAHAVLGNFPKDASAITYYVDDAAGYWHVRAGSSANIYTITPGNRFYYSADNLTTLTDLSFLVNGSYQSVGVVDAGNKLMVIEYYGALYRSEDYGATFELITGLPANFRANAIYCKNSTRWIAAGHSMVWPYPAMICFSDDFGDTWTEKTGNLDTFVPYNGFVTKVIGI